MYSIKPDYYDDFSCIADDCPITCCQEWKISVDELTRQKWHDCKPPADTVPLHPSLDAYVTKKDGEAVIALNARKQCPFLKENKLCKLVLAHGDSILSETCAQFPRQFHTFDDHIEYSLAPCCPEVVRLLDKKEPVRIITVPHTDSESAQNTDADSTRKTTADFLPALRTCLTSLMQNTDYSPPKALLMIFYILLDIKDKHIATAKELDSYISNSMLCKLSQAIDDMHTEPLDTFDECNELFLDLQENYRKEQLYTNYLKEAALLAENYAETYEADTLEEKLQDFSVMMKHFEQIFRNYLISELFSSLLLPASDFSDMLTAVEWIAMEYAAIRHLFFLRMQKTQTIAAADHLSTDCPAVFDTDTNTSPEYILLRDSIVIVSRMMGYDEEDIREYLANSFESIIWDWGYLALLIGK